MESRIPLPTDNIYKFYALFGLLLFIFSIGALLYQNQVYNEVVFTAVPELEDLKQVAQPIPSQKAKIAVLEKRIEITRSDRRFGQYALGAVSGIGMALMFYGFRRWHAKIQPILDRTTKVQLEIAELQLKKLKQELEPNSSPPTDAIETKE